MLAYIKPLMKDNEGVHVLKYCAWCGKYQGLAAPGGHQIRKNICEIDTATICPTCWTKVVKELSAHPHASR